MKKTTIYDLHTSFYIIQMQKLAFNLPHVCILETCHCGNTFCEAFKCRAYFRYGLFHHDYADRVVASFEYRIQSEYYGSNWYVYIEGVTLEHFSVSTKTKRLSAPQSFTWHAVFHFFSDDTKQHAATTAIQQNIHSIVT